MKPRFFDPTVKHLVYLYTLLVPSLDAECLHQLWPKHPMFKDYPQPSARTIRRWRLEFQAVPRRRKKQWIKI